MENKFVLPEKWFIIINSEEEAKVYRDYFENQCRTTWSYSINFSYGWNGECIVNAVSEHNEFTKITFEQFKQYVLKENTMKEQFPKDDFGVIIENNGKEIVDYLVSKGFDSNGCVGSNNVKYYYTQRNPNRLIASSINSTSKTYTLQQLKSLDMEQNYYWKLKKDCEQYALSAINIISFYHKGDFVKELNDYFKLNREELSYIGKLKKAGVLELWFEKVYEETPKFKEGDWVVCIRKPFEKASVTLNKAAQLTTYGNKGNLEFSGFAIIGDVDSTDCFRFATPQEIEDASTKVVRMGGDNGFDLTIKGGKVFHKSEDITSFITDMKIWSESQLIKQKQFGKYVAMIEDIIFSKTGCESKPTKLSEWLKISEIIK